jgi:1-acyl-sn-glycerol-3-phosphate acyltransferase
MEAQNSSTGPVSSDVSDSSPSDEELSLARIPKNISIPSGTFLWRMLHWPFSFFCCTWVRVRTQGQEHIDNSKGGLFLINHQSFLDPLLVAVKLTRPVSYLARDNLFRIPILGWILRHTHVIPISREAARGGSIRVAVERLEAGFLVGLFPEGTRSTDDEVHRLSGWHRRIQSRYAEGCLVHPPRSSSGRFRASADSRRCQPVPIRQRRRRAVRPGPVPCRGMRKTGSNTADGKLREETVRFGRLSLTGVA